MCVLMIQTPSVLKTSVKSALHKRISQHLFLFVSFLLFGGDKGAELLTWKVLCRTWQFVETVR